MELLSPERAAELGATVEAAIEALEDYTLMDSMFVVACVISHLLRAEDDRRTILHLEALTMFIAKEKALYKLAREGLN